MSLVTIQLFNAKLRKLQHNKINDATIPGIYECLNDIIDGHAGLFTAMDNGPPYLTP